jgi:hypothetical protein
MELHPDIVAGLNWATMRKLIFSLFLLTLSTPSVPAQQYDLVLEGGRVMDPETGTDAVSNVGIRDGKIVRISSEALSGRRVVHARVLDSLTCISTARTSQASASRRSMVSPRHWSWKSARPTSLSF